MNKIHFYKLINKIELNFFNYLYEILEDLWELVKEIL